MLTEMNIRHQTRIIWYIMNMTVSMLCSVCDLYFCQESTMTPKAIGNGFCIPGFCCSCRDESQHYTTDNTLVYSE